MIAKQFLSCKSQLDANLAKFNLDLKSKLTIPEMQYYLQGTDLSNIPLSALQNLLIAVLLI